MMKSLFLSLALFGMVIAAPQKSNAAEVVHGPRGTAVHTGGGTAVHTDHNWNDAYWHTNRLGTGMAKEAIGTGSGAIVE